MAHPFYHQLINNFQLVLRYSVFILSTHTDNSVGRIDRENVVLAPP